DTGALAEPDAAQRVVELEGAVDRRADEMERTLHGDDHHQKAQKTEDGAPSDGGPRRSCTRRGSWVHQELKRVGGSTRTKTDNLSFAACQRVPRSTIFKRPLRRRATSRAPSPNSRPASRAATDFKRCWV